MADLGLLRNPYANGKIEHPPEYRRRRFLNWFPLGIAYSMLYMGRYNLTVAQGALGDLMPKQAFGEIFFFGTLVYGIAFVVNGPLTDRMGGKRAMLLALLGACLANVGLGYYVRSVTGAPGTTTAAVTTVMSVIYSLNMYFQSFGAVAIVKVNASWFHVRERGSFSGIFGIMISSGIFFAFDINERLLRWLEAGRTPGEPVPTWVVFIVPAALLGFMLLVELFLLKDWPSHAGHYDIETGDASSGDESQFSTADVLKRILTNPVILTVAAIEFCTGVLRNGVMHWFRIYAKENVQAIGAGAAGGQVGGDVGWVGTLVGWGVLDEKFLKLPVEAIGWEFTLVNWGLLLMIAGIIGGNVAGLVSDKVFQSRRAPAAGLLYLLTTASIGVMAVTLQSPWVLCLLVFLISLGVIGTHGLLSGTATMDFGGRKGAATAVGVIDGCVYLGTAVQSISLGYLTQKSWTYWPIFLLPFGVIGLLLLRMIWHAMPKGKKSGEH